MAQRAFYQAIITKYLGPTNVRGSRVKATAATGSVTLHWSDARTSDWNHAKAAETLARKFGWLGEWYGGTLHSGEHCFVCTDAGSNAAFSIEAQPMTHDEIAAIITGAGQ